MGIDPIWFGIFFVILIEIALISPPVGLNLFVIQAVAKTTLGTVIRGVTPFILIMLLSVIILVLVPSIILYIPLELN